MRTSWLLLVLLATTPAFSAPKVPFLEAMKRLDSTEKKLEHLRGWHSGLAMENGIRHEYLALHYGSLLELFPLHHVDDEGVLDCSSLYSDLEDNLSVRYKLSHSDSSYDSIYVMFNITAEELCPENATSYRSISSILALSREYPSRALAIMDRIVELRKKHDLQLPVVFLLSYAEVAFSAKSYEDALEAVQKYLAAADSDHGDYGEALKLREAIQEKVRKGQRSCRESYFR